MSNGPVTTMIGGGVKPLTGWDTQTVAGSTIFPYGPAATNPAAAPLGQLATALAKAQAELRPAVKDSTNPHFRSKYADVASVWEACRAALTKHGLSVVQMPSFSDGAVHLKTVLLHASGEHMESTLSIPLGQVNAQTIGSAITYARRYALMAVVGIAPDEDDDGNAASRDAARTPESVTPAAKPNPGNAGGAIVTARAQALWKEAQGLKWSREQFTAWYQKHGVASMKDASMADMEKLEAAWVAENPGDIQY